MAGSRHSTALHQGEFEKLLDPILRTAQDAFTICWDKWLGGWLRECSYLECRSVSSLSACFKAADIDVSYSTRPSDGNIKRAGMKGSCFPTFAREDPRFVQTGDSVGAVRYS